MLDPYEVLWTASQPQRAMTILLRCLDEIIPPYFSVLAVRALKIQAEAWLEHFYTSRNGVAH